MAKRTRKEIIPLTEYIPEPSKTFFIDWSVFVHKSIFAWNIAQNQAIPATYLCINSIITCLKELKATINDRVIIAMDSYSGNWRKEIDSQYKADRAEKRKETGIDFNYHFAEMNKLLTNINQSTPWIPIQIDKLEADDIISYGCRYYKDDECIIVTTDSDLQQMFAFKNVKIFSPISKKFKDYTNPYTLLAKKIEKEATDNLISPVQTQEEYEKRNMIVNLLSLPKNIEDVLKTVYDELKPKDKYELASLRFNKPKERLIQLYKGVK